jgi:hypothetical protein
MQAKLASRTSTIAGVLWHQGEADCGEELYPTYAERFQVILDELKKQLNLYDVPFLLGGLGEFLALRDDKLINYPFVNEQLKKVALTNERTGFVPADGLKSNPDNLHFCAKALHEFGLRYFDEFEKLRDENKIFTEKSAPDDAIRTEMEKL